MKTAEKVNILNFASVKFKVGEEKDNVLPVLMFNVKSESEATDEQWKQVQQIIDKYYEDQKNCRIIVDLSKTTMLFSLPYMQKWSQFFKTNRHYLKDHVSYVAFVSGNHLMRNMINVAITMNPSKTPFYVAGTKNEAFDF